MSEMEQVLLCKQYFRKIRVQTGFGRDWEAWGQKM